MFNFLQNSNNDDKIRVIVCTKYIVMLYLYCINSKLKIDIETYNLGVVVF